MKQFKISSTDGQIHSLDMTNLILSKKGPGELETEEGYYDDETEKYLSDLYEGPLSKLLETLINNPYHDLSQYDCNLIGIFLLLCMLEILICCQKHIKKQLLLKG